MSHRLSKRIHLSHVILFLWVGILLILFWFAFAWLTIKIVWLTIAEFSIILPYLYHKSIEGKKNKYVPMLMQACNMNQTAVFRVYDSLVGNRVRDDSTEDLLSLAVKPRVFTSLLIICTSLAQQLQDKQPGFFYNQLPTGVRREVWFLYEATSLFLKKMLSTRISLTMSHWQKFIPEIWKLNDCGVKSCKFNFPWLRHLGFYCNERGLINLQIYLQLYVLIGAL